MGKKVCIWHDDLVGVIDIDDDKADDLLFLEQIVHFYGGLELRIRVVLDPFCLPDIQVLVAPVVFVVFFWYVRTCRVCMGTCACTLENGERLQRPGHNYKDIIMVSFFFLFECTRPVLQVASEIALRMRHGNDKT
jgi:hypothetical protein